MRGDGEAAMAIGLARVAFFAAIGVVSAMEVARAEAGRPCRGQQDEGDGANELRNDHANGLPSRRWARATR